MEVVVVEVMVEVVVALEDSGGGGSIVITISPVSGCWKVMSKLCFSACVKSGSRCSVSTSTLPLKMCCVWCCCCGVSGSGLIMGGGQCFLGRPGDKKMNIRLFSDNKGDISRVKIINKYRKIKKINILIKK